MRLSETTMERETADDEWTSKAGGEERRGVLGLAILGLEQL